MPPLKIRHDVVRGKVDFVAPIGGHGAPSDEFAVGDREEGGTVPPTGTCEREHSPDSSRPESGPLEDTESGGTIDHVSLRR